MARTPAKSQVLSASRTPSIYASQVSVDELHKKVDVLTTMMTEVLSLIKTPPSVPPPPPIPSLAPVSDLIREVYQACSNAVSDKSAYVDKETRAVIIGSLEPKTPEEGLKKDEDLVSSLIAYSGSPIAEKALTDRKVTYHRHPSDRPPHKRPLKIQFESKEVRDSFLAGIRSKKGRPPPLVSPSSFVRIDLTPTQLKLEREAREEAVRKNLEVGQLQYGVRDYSLICYRNPRPLPDNYGQPRAPRNLAADIHSPDLLSSSTCPSPAPSLTHASTTAIASTKTPNVTLRKQLPSSK